MCVRSITVGQEYFTGDQEKLNRSLNISCYPSYSLNSSSGEQISFDLDKVISPDIDIFSSLPQFVFENDHARLFLNAMKSVLMSIDKYELKDVSLSKLIVTEHSNITLVLEWIFEYFRFYFSFDKVEGDSWGEVFNDLSKGKFYNSFNKMEKEDYKNIAKKEVNLVLRMVRGEFYDR